MSNSFIAYCSDRLESEIVQNINRSVDSRDIQVKNEIVIDSVMNSGDERWHRYFRCENLEGPAHRSIKLVNHRGMVYQSKMGTQTICMRTLIRLEW